MIKKQAMAAGRQFGKTGLTTDQNWWDKMWDNTPRLETGYTDNQPKWPYWVKPHNYSAEEWLEMNVWMLKTFGNTDWPDQVRRVGSDRMYWFRNEADRTLFLLRWS
jgi:hypothetical protein